MNSSKWWILFLVLLWIPLQVQAQTTTLSLEDVVEQFKQHSLQQELAKLEELRKQGMAHSINRI